MLRNSANWHSCLQANHPSLKVCFENHGMLTSLSLPHLFAPKCDSDIDGYFIAPMSWPDMFHAGFVCVTRFSLSCNASSNLARVADKTINIGSLFDYCVEKQSELAAHLRKYKGRVVFGGNNVRDEFGLAAMFPE